MVRYHKGGIEPHAELPDDFHILAGLVFPLKVQTAALGDGAQVLFQLLGGHAAAVIGDGKQPVFLIHRQGDLVVAAGKGNAVIGQRAEIQLINGIASIADKLPQENLLVGVNGIDHHIQQLFAFGFELLRSHGHRLLCFLFYLFASAPATG